MIPSMYRRTLKGPMYKGKETLESPICVSEVPLSRPLLSCPCLLPEEATIATVTYVGRMTLLLPPWHDLGLIAGECTARTQRNGL